MNEHIPLFVGNVEYPFNKPVQRQCTNTTHWNM